MKKRKQDHVSNQGEQIQELEDRIRKELEKLGLIEVSFDYGEFNQSYPPRFSYRLKKGHKNTKTCPLALRLRNRICKNFSSNVYDIVPLEDIKTIDGRMIVFYTETLLMTPERIRDNYQFRKRLLGFFLNELKNYNP